MRHLNLAIWEAITATGCLTCWHWGQCCYDGVGEIGGAGFAADVAGGVFGFGVDLVYGLLDAEGGAAFAQVLEHHDGTEEQGSGISEAFAGDVGCGAVDGLEHGAVVADVAAGDDAQSADQACGQIAHHVAVEIREQQDVELARVEHDLHAGVVYDELFVFYFRIARRDGANRFQEQAIRQFHDVGLVDGVNFFAAVFLGIVEREFRDARRGFLSDDLQALDDAGNDLVLEARVEIFGIFANDHDIDAVEARFHAGEILDRAQVRIEVEGLSQRDVDAGCATGDRSAHGALERDFVAANGLNGAFVEQGSGIGHPILGAAGCIGAGFDLLPINVDACGFEDALVGGRNFRADAFAGDQRDLVSHGSIVLYAMG